MSEHPRRRGGYPMLSIMAGNALLLSTIYLAVGLVVELLLRYKPTRFLIRLQLALDSLPARALEVTGLMQPLSEAYLSRRITESGVRLVFGATTILLIFFLALVVGLVMGGLRVWLERRSPRDVG